MNKKPRKNFRYRRIAKQKAIESRKAREWGEPIDIREAIRKLSKLEVKE